MVDSVCSNKKKNSQISVEYATIVGIALSIIVMLLAAYNTLSSSAESEMNSEQIDKVGDKLVSDAKRVYQRGGGTRFTQTLNFPDTIVNMSIEYRYVNSSLNYTFFNITQEGKGGVYEHHYAPERDYVKLNCEKCRSEGSADYSTNNFSLLYNRTDYADGSRDYVIKKRGDYVYIDRLIRD